MNTEITFNEVNMENDSGGGGRGAGGKKEKRVNVENINSKVKLKGDEYRISLGPVVADGKRYIFASRTSGAGKGRRYDIGFIDGKGIARIDDNPAFGRASNAEIWELAYSD